MAARDILRAHMSDPSVAQVRAAAEVAPWWITLSANATVVELAVLMHGLGCKVRADHAGGGEFCIVPMDPQAPRPSTELVHDILTRGFGDRLPTLVCDPLPARAAQVEKFQSCAALGLTVCLSDNEYCECRRQGWTP